MKINNSIIKIVGLLGGIEKKTAQKQYNTFLEAGYQRDLYPLDKEGNKSIKGTQFLRDYFYPDFRKIMFLDDTDAGNSRFIKKPKSKLIVNLIYHKGEVDEKIYPIEITQTEIFSFEGHIGLFSISISPSSVESIQDASNITSIIRNFDADVKDGGSWHEWISEHLLCGIKLRGENVKADEFSGSKFKLYTVYDLEGDNPTDNNLLFDLGTCTRLGSTEGKIPGFIPNQLYLNKIINNKVSVFKNWEALALFDTFTCIGSGQLNDSFIAWENTYFRLYLYRLFFKYNLYRYNSEIFESNENAIKVRDQFENFLNRYDISHVSFNFLSNEMFAKIGQALELDLELEKFRIRINNLSDKIQEERESKTNMLLQVVTGLGAISSVGPILAAVDHFKEKIGFSSLAFYAIISLLIVFVGIGVLYFIVPHELKKVWKKIKSIFQ
jgi:hypothetical protein